MATQEQKIYMSRAIAVLTAHASRGDGDAALVADIVNSATGGTPEGIFNLLAGMISLSSVLLVDLAEANSASLDKTLQELALRWAPA